LAQVRIGVLPKFVFCFFGVAHGIVL